MGKRKRKRNKKKKGTQISTQRPTDKTEIIEDERHRERTIALKSTKKFKKQKNRAKTNKGCSGYKGCQGHCYRHDQAVLHKNKKK